MKRRWNLAIGVIVIVFVASIYFHLPPRPDTQGLLPRFDALLNSQAASDGRLDVSNEICGKISAEQLAALYSEVGGAVIEYRPGEPGFWTSDKGDEWWLFRRRENFVYAKVLWIRMNAESGRCSAGVSFEAPYP